MILALLYLMLFLLAIGFRGKIAGFFFPKRSLDSAPLDSLDILSVDLAKSAPSMQEEDGRRGKREEKESFIAQDS